jgi:hypothetical protein
MRPTLLVHAVAAGAALTSILLAAAPAAAGPTVAVPTVAVRTVAVPAAAAGRDTRLAIVVRPAVGEASSAWLTCDPTGGTHRRAGRACAVLRLADGDPHSIPAGDGFCTMEYAPVTATLRGRWHGQAVRYRETFGNRCTLRQATGQLFQI